MYVFNYGLLSKLNSSNGAKLALLTRNCVRLFSQVINILGLTLLLNLLLGVPDKAYAFHIIPEPKA